MTKIFDQIIYGPVHSRRLGSSLGVNLSPIDGKRCTFDCIYCECGLNKERHTRRRPPSRQEVNQALTEQLAQLSAEKACPERITFSGNGEPTLHHDFIGIIDDTIAVRDRLYPSTKIAVLSNSTLLHQPDIVQALCRVDENLMKFDAATDRLIRLIDQPVSRDFTTEKLIAQLQQFHGRLTIQTIFLKGDYLGVEIDNTNDKDVEVWIEALKKIRPQQVMIYTINRETPIETLQKIPFEKMEQIAEKVRQAGIQAIVYE